MGMKIFYHFGMWKYIIKFFFISSYRYSLLYYIIKLILKKTVFHKHENRDNFCFNSIYLTVIFNKVNENSLLFII